MQEPGCGHGLSPPLAWGHCAISTHLLPRHPIPATRSCTEPGRLHLGHPRAALTRSSSSLCCLSPHLSLISASFPDEVPHHLPLPPHLRSSGPWPGPVVGQDEAASSALQHQPAGSPAPKPAALKPLLLAFGIDFFPL